MRRDCLVELDFHLEQQFHSHESQNCFISILYLFYNVCCIDSLSSEAAISRPGIVLLGLLLYCSTVDIP